VIVLDASAVIRALLGNPAEAADARRAFVTGGHWYAPGVLYAEVLHRFRAVALNHGEEIRRRRAEAAFREFASWNIAPIESAQLAVRAWELRHNIDASDALYVAAAEQLGCALVTADARLAKADGTRCQFVIV
jgi:predicted nucleic acid-binding protein